MQKRYSGVFYRGQRGIGLHLHYLRLSAVGPVHAGKAAFRALSVPAGTAGESLQGRYLGDGQAAFAYGQDRLDLHGRGLNYQTGPRVTFMSPQSLCS